MLNRLIVLETLHAIERTWDACMDGVGLREWRVAG